ncbi:MAG TPA: hypothetical protein VK017_10925, partial [Sphingobacterium sp.]|nr:hypothetical protein [Sphingobacterium sp.]
HFRPVSFYCLSVIAQAIFVFSIILHPSPWQQIKFALYAKTIIFVMYFESSTLINTFQRLGLDL